jgi:hypothetical protein
MVNFQLPSPGQFSVAVDTVACFGVGAMRRIPVSVAVLFPLAAGGEEMIKFVVLNTLSADCATGGNICVVGGSSPPSPG